MCPEFPDRLFPEIEFLMNPMSQTDKFIKWLYLSLPSYSFSDINMANKGHLCACMSSHSEETFSWNGVTREPDK